ncbi:MAG: hypothetical protein AAFZ65_18395, partial [Planctomycetota bacterium]
MLLRQRSSAPALALLVGVTAIVALAGCGREEAPTPGAAPPGSSEPSDRPAANRVPQDPETAPRTEAVHWLSAAGSIAGEPAACMDRAGRLWTAWLAWGGGAPTLEVVCHRRSATGWSPSIRGRLEEHDPGLGFVRLAAFGEGAYAVYESGVGEDRRVVGRALSVEGERLGVDRREVIARGGLSPDLAAGAAGELVAVWQQLDGEAYDIAWRRRTSAGWEAESHSTETPWDEWSPRAAAGPDGSVWLAWDGYVEASFDVFCFGPLGAPGEGLHRIAGSERYEASPDLAVDREGRPWIAYEVAPSFGIGGAVREQRDVELVRLEADGRTRAASLEGSLALGGQLPRVTLEGEGLLLTVRRNDPPYFPANSKNITNQGLHHAWSTWALRLEGADWEVRAVDGASGDNEETSCLVADGGMLFAVLAGDARREAFDEADLWVEVLEQDWRVGVTPLGAAGDRPALGPARATAPLPDPAAHVPRARDARWLFGDLHRHTHLSRCAGDADGTRLDTYRYARGPGALDFVSITDHFQHLSRWSWWRSLRDVERYHAPPSLVVLPGLERFLMRVVALHVAQGPP